MNRHRYPTKRRNFFSRFFKKNPKPATASRNSASTPASRNHTRTSAPKNNASNPASRSTAKASAPKSTEQRITLEGSNKVMNYVQNLAHLNSVMSQSVLGKDKAAARSIKTRVLISKLQKQSDDIKELTQKIEKETDSDTRIKLDKTLHGVENDMRETYISYIAFMKSPVSHMNNTTRQGTTLNQSGRVEEKRLNALAHLKTLNGLKAQMNATRNGPGKQKLKQQYDTLFKKLTETFSL